MAHIGSYVPADQATIALTDRIFTAISNVDSVSISQSTFAQDLSQVRHDSVGRFGLGPVTASTLQISTMLRHCTASSLLLVDEFGTGTAPTDGVALLTAVINELLQRGQECPKTLITTHFMEALNVLPSNPQVSAY
eukprot:SAG31_NODE_1558_length_7885_cov_2.567300_9_plen_136_part_00